MWKDIKSVILESDTIYLEIFIPLFTAVWGLWLGTASRQGNATFWQVVASSGGFHFWSLTAIVLSLLQLSSVFIRNMKRHRLAMCHLAGVYYTVITYLTLKLEQRLFIPWMTGAFAFACLWLVFRLSRDNRLNRGIFTIADRGT